ncbi:MAG TPA: class I SAM-dependent methyltransferase [Phycisphaerales bacterium]|nr:class I SAM-dependent methyltransferase [Phycisphaerales bacterium]
MKDAAQPDYLRPYHEAVRRFGPGFQSTLWASREGQILRFDVLIDLGEISGGRILDIGCATGDFAQRLIDRHIPFDRYVGIDGLSDLVRAAQARNLPRTEFRHADVLSDTSAMVAANPDHVVISGTLNTMPEPVARTLLENAWRIARSTLAFNFLSDRCSKEMLAKDLGPSHRFRTIEWVNWALTLSPRVAFRQDYMDGHDATIVIRK